MSDYNPYQHLFDEDPEEDPTYVDPQSLAMDLAVPHNYKAGPIMGTKHDQSRNPRRRPR